mmetsp:Transcript_4795/g.30408  ORF Transcript_4795/g.30408 Transcript_4795/m.30408 type:complete len:270 (+) Transcript_4795:2589-3398(+)
MPMHAVSAFAFALQFVGYVLLSWWLMQKRRNQANVDGMLERKRWEGTWPGLVLVGYAHSSTRMHPKQPAIATVNLVVSAFVAGCVAEATARERSAIVVPWQHAQQHRASSWLMWILAGLWDTLHWWPLVKAVAWQALLEYYWHRLMHLPWFYRRFHKLHHYQKDPGPFDDLLIHPAEAFGYFCILYSPAFVLGPMPLGSFLAYMGIMGVLGVLDHSGVEFAIPFLYDTRDHAMHHALYNVNYAFPFIWMDSIHGTYRKPFSSKDQQSKD